MRVRPDLDLNVRKPRDRAARRAHVADMETARENARDMLDQEACYRAVLTRDPRFDGRFFTCVKTTGIYCRPVCPARTPKRENMTFVISAAAAEEAGFRACLRCRSPAASVPRAFPPVCRLPDMRWTRRPCCGWGMPTSRRPTGTCGGRKSKPHRL